MSAIPTPEIFDEWPELVSLDNQLDGTPDDIQRYRNILQAGRQRLIERFNNNKPIKGILQAQAHLVDAVLIRVWRTYAGVHFMRLCVLVLVSTLIRVRRRVKFGHFQQVPLVAAAENAKNRRDLWRQEE